MAFGSWSESACVEQHADLLRKVIHLLEEQIASLPATFECGNSPPRLPPEVHENYIARRRMNARFI